MQTVVISDVHIGTNYKTCWYQQSVHEPYMLALLDYILQNANQGANPVNRLVILGDLFDFWTYPPSMDPPTIDEILAAHPNLFGPNGKFTQVVQALKGNVQYLHGNHDILLTQADLNKIPGGGHQIQLLPDIYPDASGIVFTHGHLATMFNAPDVRYPGEVPVGHFVTRAICHMLDTTLPPGQTAANLPDQGSPYGFSLSSFIPGLNGQFTNPSITNLLLDYVATRCQFSITAPIKMGTGQAQTTISAAKTKYDGLFTQWVAQNGGGAEGATIAAKSAQADYDGSYMAWFAQQFAFRNNAKGIVMGHTHIPKVGIVQSWCQYVNSGFECPSIPDIQAGRTHWNFTMIAQDGTMQLMQVVYTSGSYQIQPTSAPPDQLVYSPFEDYSCYVRINNGSTDLVLQTAGASSGYYATKPPARIPANQTGEFWIQDYFGTAGSAGTATYIPDIPGGKPSAFSFSCPTLSANTASGGTKLLAGSKNPPSPNGPYNQVPSLGHPLFVEFFIEKSAYIPVYSSGRGIGGYDLADNRDRAFAFDYDGGGKLDHLVLYRPGTGTIWFLKNNGGQFTKLPGSTGSPGNGVGGYDLADNRDQVFAFDYDGSGKLDHLVLYRPGTGTIWFLKNLRNNAGQFTRLPGSGANGVGGYDLADNRDQVFVFDYDGSGKLDHLVLYRPGTGTIWFLKNLRNNGGQFTKLPGSGANGVGGYDLADGRDRIFAFDYDGSGKLDHLLLYRPGTGTIWFLKNLRNNAGEFTKLPGSTGSPGNGIGGYDLKDDRDRAFAFDYDGSGKLDHPVLYRSGTGTIWIFKKQ
jgi:UDP-2,3-diacylglucosamine pyrophosphatase LpxH